MKFKLLVLTTFLLFGAHAANAQLFGWQGSVTFSGSSGLFSVNVSGPTYLDCEIHRANVKSLYSPPAYTVVAETPCIPLIFDLDRFRIPELIPESKIPWPRPECLSCPYLREDLLKYIYPQEYDKVIRLMDKFGIQEYNRALEELNMQYDLEGFSNEMQKLEQLQQFEQMKH